MDKFLVRVAKHIVSHEFYGIQHTVIVPNRRAGLYLQKRISELIDKPVFLPKILPIEEYFFHLSGLVKVEPTEQLLRLYQSFCSQPSDDHSFDKFLNWGQTFLSDCNEIDTNLIDIQEFFTLLYQDKEIRNWNLSEELTQLQKNYLSFWKNAQQLYQQFTTSLLNDGRAYNGLAYRYTIDKLPSLLGKTAKHSILVAGFNALNRAEDTLFSYLDEHQLATFFWDTDEYYINDIENKAGRFFREYQSKWSHKDLQTPPSQIGRNTQQITIIKAPNPVSQCDVVAQLVTELNTSSPAENIAIILADELMLDPLLYRLPKDKTYNITMGKALKTFPLYHLFDQILLLFAQRAENDSVLSGVLSNLLRSSYMQFVDNDNKKNELLQFLLESNSHAINYQDVSHIITEQSIWKKLLTFEKSSQGVLLFIQEIIEHLRIECLQKENQLDIQVLFECKKIIQQLQTYLSQFSITISIPSIRKLFQQICVATKIPYDGEPLTGIQIMGVLETRCLDFDQLILLSANEGILPKGNKSASFIPFVFKKHFQIQTFQEKDAIYAYTFYRLLHSCKTNTFLYSEKDKGEMSRFLLQLVEEFPKGHVKQIGMNYHLQTKSETQYQIKKTPEIIEKIEHYLTHKGLSPSTINLLVRSPLDFYFQKIVGIQEPAKIETEMELNTFGTIVHDTLEELYKPYIGKYLDDEFFAQAKGEYEKSLDKQCKKNFKNGNTSMGMNYLYKNAAKILVSQCLELDQKRIKKHQIKILDLEQSLSCTYPFLLHGKPYQVKINGKADRIQQRDEVIEIIDYKTGNVDASYLKQEQINQIKDHTKYDKLQQLLCYTFMGSQGRANYPLEQVRAAIFPLKKWNSGLVFINKDPDFSFQLRDIELYHAELTAILEQLLDPAIPFVPENDKNKLRYSVYKQIYL